MKMTTLYSELHIKPVQEQEEKNFRPIYFSTWAKHSYTSICHGVSNETGPSLDNYICEYILQFNSGQFTVVLSLSILLGFTWEETLTQYLGIRQFI